MPKLNFEFHLEPKIQLKLQGPTNRFDLSTGHKDLNY
jgi:hypothetical protein